MSKGRILIDYNFKSVIVLILTIITILFGCDSETSKISDDPNLLQETNQEQFLLDTIKGLEEIIEQQNVQIDSLQEQLEAVSSKDSDPDSGREISNSITPASQLDQVISKNPWLRKLNYGDWEAIHIYRYEGDTQAASIDDPRLMKSINFFTLHSLEGLSYPNGYQTDIDGYTYEFRKGSEVYKVQIVDRGVMKVGGFDGYIGVSLDAHLLGKAVMPKPFYVQHTGLLAKMAESGAVIVGDQYAMFKSFRIKSIVNTILYNDQTGIVARPNILGELVETFTFYFYGEELRMDLYENHVYLSGEGEEEWYQVPSRTIIQVLAAG